MLVNFQFDFSSFPLACVVVFLHEIYSCRVLVNFSVIVLFPLFVGYDFHEVDLFLVPVVDLLLHQFIVEVLSGKFDAWQELRKG